MGSVEELIEKKGNMLLKLLDLMEGKEVKTRMDLSGIQFQVGKNVIKLSGEVEFTVVRKSK